MRSRYEEELTKAFRKAVEANQNAPARLSSIIAAPAIARDAHEEASYAHPRKFERQPLRQKPRHTVFISALAVVVLAHGICLLLANDLTRPDGGTKVAEVTARGPPMIAAAQPPAPTRTTAQEEPPGNREGAVVPSIATAPSTATGAAERGDLAGNAENALAPSLPGSGVEVAKVTADTGAAIDRPDVKTTADKLKESERVEPPGQNPYRAMAGALSVTCQTSGLAGDGYWAWRLIDGRKCWYKGAAGTDKSLLHWPPLQSAVAPSIALAPSAATGAAARRDVAGNTENAPAPSLPGSGVEVAKVIADTRAAIDRPDVKTTAEKLKESERVEPPGQNPHRDMAGALSLTCQTSGPAGDRHWAWRLIDGRKCWYKGAAGMNKSLLHWPPLEHVPELQ